MRTQCIFNLIRHNFIIIALMASGCVHSPDHMASSATKGTGIEIYVGGSVNRPGKLQLSFPFTIEHAIQHAGGIIDGVNENQIRRVSVRHKGEMEKFFVLRNDYSRFLLVEGDILDIPGFGYH